MAFSPREIEEISRHFAALTAKVPLRPITDEREYDEAVRVLNASPFKVLIKMSRLWRV